MQHGLELMKARHAICLQRQRICRQTCMLLCVQEEVDKLDKEILDRHAQELADLQTRQTHEEASHDSPADVMHLADSLYDTKLSAGTQKAWVSHSSAPFDLVPHVPMSILSEVALFPMGVCTVMCSIAWSLAGLCASRENQSLTPGTRLPAEVSASRRRRRM